VARPVVFRETRVTIDAVNPGTRVEVRTRYEERWTRGFEVTERVEGDNGPPAYRVRRRSDGSILPVTFRDDDLREERRRQYPWWG
jgi:hypothetical protein